MGGGGGAVGRLVGQAVEARQQPKTQGLRCNFVSLSLSRILSLHLSSSPSIFLSLRLSPLLSIFLSLFYPFLRMKHICNKYKNFCVQGCVCVSVCLTWYICYKRPTPPPLTQTNNIKQQPPHFVVEYLVVGVTNVVEPPPPIPIY